jgi:hypothetical protein
MKKYSVFGSRLLTMTTTRISGCFDYVAYNKGYEYRLLTTPEEKKSEEEGDYDREAVSGRSWYPVGKGLWEELNEEIELQGASVFADAPWADANKVRETIGGTALESEVISWEMVPHGLVLEPSEPMSLGRAVSFVSQYLEAKLAYCRMFDIVALTASTLPNGKHLLVVSIDSESG